MVFSIYTYESQVKHGYFGKVIKNPYPEIAIDISKKYSKNDTVVFASHHQAALTLIYLKRSDVICEVVDSRENNNKIYIKNNINNKIEIFDFTGKTTGLGN